MINKYDAPGAYWVPYITERKSTVVSRPMLHHLDYANGSEAVKIIKSNLALNDLVFYQDNPDLLQSVLSRIEESAIYVYTDQPVNLPWANKIFSGKTIFVYRIK